MYHFTGIKGTGMAALAEILYDEGKDVQGSDIEKYIFTEDGLRKRNIPIFPFSPDNIHDGDIVIAGLSFNENFPEVQAAVRNPKVELYWYNEYLGELLKNYTSICVAGCHGKSTTTGLAAAVLENQKPTGFLIGDGHGHMPKNAEYFILESCEFKRHFLAYRPDYAILTNIELDHIDYYKDLDDYISAFQSFASQIKKAAIIFGDDPYLKKLNYPEQVQVVTYGEGDHNDYIAKEIRMDEHGMFYSVWHDGKKLADVDLCESGRPFLWDSLGVFALASTLGMEPEAIVKGLQSYQGINRRFVIEEAGDSILVDDYAHHPTALRYMIEAARKRWPDRKIVALYKPDRYSRLQYFLDGFADALNTADIPIVLDFPKNAVREDETITVTIEDLLHKLRNGMLLDVDEASAEELEKLGPAVFLFMSSKDIYLLKDMLKKRLG